MEYATVRDGQQEVAALVSRERGVVLARDLGAPAADGLLDLILAGALPQLAAAAEAASSDLFRPVADVAFAAPYRHPRMLWGIGLNYREHAADLESAVPDEPASFIKGDHTVIGPGEPIPIPVQSERTTAEAELGLVIGRTCRDVEPEDALSYLLGVCPVLDQTAEDILQRNPRFLTRSKNFPGFFSFGPTIVPLGEATGGRPIGELSVTTIVGGERRQNVVANMLFDPALLISFHSKVMPLQPGDIISSGTPGALVIRAGDEAVCDIPGVGVLRNPVIDQPGR